MGLRHPVHDSANSAISCAIFPGEKETRRSKKDRQNERKRKKESEGERERERERERDGGKASERDCPRMEKSHSGCPRTADV